MSEEQLATLADLLDQYNETYYGYKEPNVRLVTKFVAGHLKDERDALDERERVEIAERNAEVQND